MLFKRLPSRLRSGESHDVFERDVRLRSFSSQRLLEIGDEILRALQADRHAKEIIGNTVRGMHDRSRVLNQAFRAAEAAGVDKETDPRCRVDRPRSTSFDAKREHSAKIPHLLCRNRVSRVRCHAGVKHAGDLRMIFQRARDTQCVRGMGAHSRAKRSDAAVYEPARERRRHGTQKRANLKNLRVQILAPLENERSSLHVAVPSEIFRRRVKRDVGAEAQGLQKSGCCERGIDQEPGAARVRDVGNAREVSDLHQRVRGCFGPDETRFRP